MPVNEIYKCKKKLEKSINNFISTEIEWIPLNSVEDQMKTREILLNFLKH